MADSLLAAVADAATNLARSVRNLPVGSPSSPARDLSEKIQEGAARLSRMLAEEMEIGDECAGLRLRELEGMAYDAEDILDELQYEAVRLQTQGRGLLPEGGSAEAVSEETVPAMEEMAVQDITPSHEIVAFMQNVEQSITKISLKFQEISEDSVALQLKKSDGRKQFEFEIPVRQPTSSLIEELCIVGRENDFEMVKEFLLSNDKSTKSNNIPVMAIVGMGGLGKTTLAQLAYNDERITNHFDLMSWVCVSESLDLVQVTQAMIESFSGEACLLSELDALHKKLRKELAGKRYLLVLDDVWELGHESIWASLIRPLHQGGSKGSKIIITTRNEEVSSIVGAASTHHLSCLLDEDCQWLFSQRVFEGRDPKALHADLIAMVKEISNKCAGVPLVAKILGSQLRWVDDVQKWRDILEGHMWDIDRKGIMPVLRLSYDLLPVHLKKCFKFCSLFPKYYKFNKDQLVQMWVAHGYIQPKGPRLIEDVGMDYFDELLWRSFFQCSPFAKLFWMHDLIHDLARFVSRNEYCSLEDGQSYGISEYIWHFSSISIRRHNEVEKVIGHVHLPRALRSFIFISNSYEWAGSMKPLEGVLPITKYLRVLDLHGSRIVHLPNSIGCLKLLRYLGLPEWMGKLPRLPDSISNLLNLRYVIYGDDVIYPAGIRKLINLREMPGFNVSSTHGHANLGELKDINSIRSLCISGISNLTSVAEANKACLEKKVHLRDLHLKWGSGASPFADEVLEGLKPNPALERLTIHYFRGRSLPSWMGQRSFSNLASVELIGCDELASFPPFGELPSLRHLSIESGCGVESIGHEFFTGGFQRLETLQLELSNLKSWCGVKNGECPHLRELIIAKCTSLALLLVFNLGALQILKVVDCPALEFSHAGSLVLRNLPSLQEIYIKEGGEKSIRGQLDASLQSFKTLTVQSMSLQFFAEELFSRLHQLQITQYENQGSLPFHHMNALETLIIEYCPKFQFTNEDPLPPTLRVLIMNECEGCRTLPLNNLNALEDLRIAGCRHLQFSNEDELPPRLRILDIRGCPLLLDWCRLHNLQLQRIRWLSIEGLDVYHVILKNVLSVQEAADAGLRTAERLQTLELEWKGDGGVGFPTNAEPEVVLENLRPHSNLVKLVICGFTGSSFATWVGDPSFSNIVYVTLSHCSQCVLLPPLGRLPNLQDLRITGAYSLEHVGNEFFSHGSSGSSNNCGRGPYAFPSLRNLEFEDLPMWKEWQGVEDGDLPSLDKLTIKHCPRLRALPHLAQLKALEVEASEQLMLHNQLIHLSSLQTLQISALPDLLQLPKLPNHLVQLVLKSLPAVADLQIPPTVRALTLERCNEAAIVASLPCLNNLVSLRISQLPELAQPLKLHNLVALQELDISDCPKLESFDCFYFSPLSHMEGLQALGSLRHLSLRDCPKLCFSASERPPSTLGYLALTHCSLLVSWCDRDLRRLAHIQEIWVDGIQVSAIKGESIRSQIERKIKKKGHRTGLKLQR